MGEDTASQMAQTKSGANIDLNNVPGHRKVQLVEEGEMKGDTFVTPENMPGAKLKALREAHSKELDAATKRTKVKQASKKSVIEEEHEESSEDEEIADILAEQGEDVGDNTYKVGEFVNYKESSYEVLKVHPRKGVLLSGVKEGKNAWVHHSKVSK